MSTTPPRPPLAPSADEMVMSIHEDDERTLVCALFGDPEFVPFGRDLFPDDFACPFARSGFESIQNLLRKQLGVDEFSFRREMVESGKLESFQRLSQHLLTSQANCYTRSQVRNLVAQVRDRSARSKLAHAGRILLNIAKDPELTVDEVLRRLGKAVNEAASRSPQRREAIPEADTIGKLADKATADAAARLAGKTVAQVIIPFGIPPLDDKIGGGEPGQVTVIAGYPSHCKSVLGLQIATNWAKGGTVYLASREMNEDSVAKRRTARELRIPVKDLTAADWDKMRGRSRDLHVDCEPVDIFRLCQKIEIFALSHKLSAVMIDFIQLFSKSPKTEDVSNTSQRIKKLAMDLNIPILALASVRKPDAAAGDKMPTVSEIKDSNQIESDASHVLMIHRPWKINPKADPRLVLVGIGKNREGETGEIIKMSFDGPTYSLGRYVQPAVVAGKRAYDIQDDEPQEPAPFRFSGIDMEDIPG